MIKMQIMMFDLKGRGRSHTVISLNFVKKKCYAFKTKKYDKISHVMKAKYMFLWKTSSSCFIHLFHIHNQMYPPLSLIVSLSYK